MSEEEKEQKNNSYINIKRSITGMIQDQTYTVFQFDDGTLLPLANLQPVMNGQYQQRRECVFCHRTGEETFLCTLDGRNYI